MQVENAEIKQGVHTDVMTLMSLMYRYSRKAMEERIIITNHGCLRPPRAVWQHIYRDRTKKLLVWGKVNEKVGLPGNLWNYVSVQHSPDSNFIQGTSNLNFCLTSSWQTWQSTISSFLQGGIMMLLVWHPIDPCIAIWWQRNLSFGFILMW